MDSKLRIDVNTIVNKVAELRNTGITDSFDLEMYFIDNMKTYYDAYPHLIKRLCREEKQDNSYLYKMLNSLDQVSTGEKTLSDVEIPLSYDLANRFLYPAVKQEELNKK